MSKYKLLAKYLEELKGRKCFKRFYLFAVILKINSQYNCVQTQIIQERLKTKQKHVCYRITVIYFGCFNSVCFNKCYLPCKPYQQGNLQHPNGNALLTFLKVG